MSEDLVLEDVAVRYGDVVAVEGVRAVARPGEITAVTGHSGAGKTTLLWAVGGLLESGSSGRIRLGERQIGDEVGSRDAGAVLIPQGSALAEVLTARDNIAYPGDRDYDGDGAVDRDDVLRISQGQEVRRMEYTFNNSTVKPRELVFRPAPIVVVEGIFVFHFEEIAKLLDLKVYIDAQEHVKLHRRIIRDRDERGYDLADVLYYLGDERRSRRIARCVKQADERGELETTLDLRRAVVRAVGPARKVASPV